MVIRICGVVAKRCPYLSLQNVIIARMYAHLTKIREKFFFCVMIVTDGCCDDDSDRWCLVVVMIVTVGGDCDDGDR